MNKPEPESDYDGRIAELSRANGALTQAIVTLTETDDVGGVLGRVLAAIADHSGAVGTAMFTYEIVKDELTMRALWMNGAIVEISEDDRAEMFRGPIRANEAPLWKMTRDADGVVVTHIHDSESCLWKEALPFHHAMGHRVLVHVPLRVGERFVGFLGLAYDRDQVALTDSQLELLKTLANQATLTLELTRLAKDAQHAAVVRERELARAAFARDLHDTLAQGFAAILAQVQSAERETTPGSDVARRLEVIRHLAHDNLVEARRSVIALRLHALETRSVKQGFRSLVESARRISDAPINLELADDLTDVPVQVEQELVRIVQEALSNAIRHARSRRIDVMARNFDRDSVHVTVYDDGVGVDLDVAKGRDGLGIIGMRERAARIGAVLTLVSEPDMGTEIIVVWSPTGVCAGNI